MKDSNRSTDFFLLKHVKKTGECFMILLDFLSLKVYSICKMLQNFWSIRWISWEVLKDRWSILDNYVFSWG
jgi:hypothetical protein